MSEPAAFINYVAPVRPDDNEVTLRHRLESVILALNELLAEREARITGKAAP